MTAERRDDRRFDDLDEQHVRLKQRRAKELAREKRRRDRDEEDEEHD